MGVPQEPIEWPTKFETWLNATEKIYEIGGDMVYKDPGTHSFWAWTFRDYLIGKYDILFGSAGYS